MMEEKSWKEYQDKIEDERILFMEIEKELENMCRAEKKEYYQWIVERIKKGEKVKWYEWVLSIEGRIKNDNDTIVIYVIDDKHDVIEFYRLPLIQLDTYIGQPPE